MEEGKHFWSVKEFQTDNDQGKILYERTLECEERRGEHISKWMKIRECERDTNEGI